MVIFVQPEASGIYEQNSVWAETCVDLAGELLQILFEQEQHHFAIIAALKAMNTIEFTQSFSLIKFCSECRNLLLVDSALLAPERKLTHMCAVIGAYC